MSDLPDIINTPIVPASADVLWTSNHEALTGLGPRQALFLSQPIAPDSPEMATLLNMIKACVLQETDYHILWMKPADVLPWSLLKSTLRPRYVVLLGVDPVQLAIQSYLFPHQVNRFSQACFVPTLPMDALNQNPDIKRHLWEYGLKPVFVQRVYG